MFIFSCQVLSFPDYGVRKNRILQVRHCYFFQSKVSKLCATCVDTITPRPHRVHSSAALSATMCGHPPWQQLFPFVASRHADVTLRVLCGWGVRIQDLSQHPIQQNQKQCWGNCGAKSTHLCFFFPHRTKLNGALQ